MSQKTDPKPAESALSRRHLFAGAGAAGALAVVAVAVPKIQAPEPVAQAKLPEAETGGYQLTEHVKRYYQTARV
jgi:hypothetical protein